MREAASLTKARNLEPASISCNEVECRMHYARQVRAEHLGSGIASLLRAVHAAAVRPDVRSSLKALLRQVEALRLQLPAAKLPGGGEVKTLTPGRSL